MSSPRSFCVAAIAAGLALGGCDLITGGDYSPDGGGTPGGSGGTSGGSGGTSGGSGGTSGGSGGSGGGSATDGGDGGPDGGSATSEKVTCTKVTGGFIGLEMMACVPEGMEGKTGQPAPLVLALHGYTQTGDELRETTQWDKLAGRHRFYVVFAHALGSRSFYWHTSGRARGQSDPAALLAMVDRMKADHDIDPDRVFVTGMSAGGFMAVAMLADYPEVFAAGASFSGGAYGCDLSCLSDNPCFTRPIFDAVTTGQTVKNAHPTVWNDPAKRKPRLMLVTGDLDGIVKSDNLARARDQWLSALGITGGPANQQLGVGDTLKGYPYQVFSKDGVSVDVATVMLVGLGHGTPVSPGPEQDQGGFDPEPSTTMRGDAGCSARQDWTNTGPLYGPYFAAKFFGLIR